MSSFSTSTNYGLKDSGTDVNEVERSAQQITYVTIMLMMASRLTNENLWWTKNGCPFITKKELRKKSAYMYFGVDLKGQKQWITGM